MLSFTAEQHDGFVRLTLPEFKGKSMNLYNVLTQELTDALIAVECGAQSEEEAFAFIGFHPLRFLQTGCLRGETLDEQGDFVAAGEAALDDECDDCGEVLEDCTCDWDPDEEDDEEDTYQGDFHQDPNNYSNRED